MTYSGSQLVAYLLQSAPPRSHGQAERLNHVYSPQYEKNHHK